MIIDPSEKKKVCSMCHQAFDVTAMQLEEIPPTGSLPDFFLHSSISLFFIIQYIWLFVVTITLVRKDLALSEFAMHCQIILHAIYGSIFFSKMRIKRLKAYWKLAQKRYAALIAMHMILLSFIATGSFITTFTVGIFLSIYWKLHIAVLEESNAELLASLRAGLL